MPVLADKRVDLSRKIREMLDQREYRPTELFQQLNQISESVLKDALASLVDAHVIELSPDRHIRLRQRARAATAQQDDRLQRR